MKTLLPALLVLLSLWSQAQDPAIQDILDEVSMDTLVRNLRDFSGEDSTTVYGNRTLIRNRVSNSGNDLAADYIKERFEWYGLDVVDQVYSEKGRNIYAVQEGYLNPESIYIICGHYDAVANYCADDNASGITAILEAARLLSTRCFENTIIYAAWDEEEIGLRGSRFFADTAAALGWNILGVLNMDMMAYDGDGDKNYDVDVRDVAGSLAIKDMILQVNADYEIDLIGNVVNPGTSASDHASFWNQGYSGVLFGEAWSTGDRTPAYHTSNDRFNTLNLPYFFEMTKLAVGYIATAASPTEPEATVSQDGNTFTVDITDAAYQWHQCGSPDVLIEGAIAQSYTPTETGQYSVNVTKGGCTLVSDCQSFEVVSHAASGQETSMISIHPNPVSGSIHLAFGSFPRKARFELFTAGGIRAGSGRIRHSEVEIDVSGLPPGVYMLEIISEEAVATYPVVKQ